MANIAELTELQHRLTKATQSNADAIRAIAEQTALLVEENRKLVAVIAQTIEAPAEDEEGGEPAAKEPSRYMDGTPIG